MDLDSNASVSTTSPGDTESHHLQCYVSSHASNNAQLELERSSAVSDVAVRRFPLTSRAVHYAEADSKSRLIVGKVENDDDDEITSMPFEHYNSRGEIIDPPPPTGYVYLQNSNLPYPYPFPLIYPLPPPPPPPPPLLPAVSDATTTASADLATNTPPISFPGFVPLPFNPRVRIRLCTTPNCNAILSRQYPKSTICKRCAERNLTEPSAALVNGNSDPTIDANANAGDSAGLESPSNLAALGLISPSSSSSSSNSNSCLSIPTPTTSTSTPPTSRSTSIFDSGRSTPLVPVPVSLPMTMPRLGSALEHVVVGKKRPRSLKPDEQKTTGAHTPTETGLYTSLPLVRHPPTSTSTSIPTPMPNTHTSTGAGPYTSLPMVMHPSTSAPQTQFQAHERPTHTRPPLPTTNRGGTIPTQFKYPAANWPTCQPRRRSCTTLACPNPVPSSSSPYIRRCMECIEADWAARKGDIERHVQARKACVRGLILGNGRQGRSRSRRTRSNESIESLLSLSSLSSLDSSSDSSSPISPTPEPEPNVVEPVPEPKHDYKVTIRFSASLWHNVKSFRYCSNVLCSRRLEEGYNWTMCLVCRAGRRERWRDLVEMMWRWKNGGVRLTDRDWGWGAYGQEEREEDGELESMPGARLCAVRWCSHIIPSREEYRWSMCLGCKRFFLNEKRRRAGESNSTINTSELASNANKERKERREWGGVVITEAEADAGEERMCASLDCGMVLVIGGTVGGASSSSLCLQCTRRKAREIERVERVRENVKDAVRCDHDSEKDIVNLQMKDICIPSPIPAEPQLTPLATSPSLPISLPRKTTYPEYLSLTSLSAHFRTQLYAFLQDQVLLVIRRKVSTASPAVTPGPTTAPVTTTPTTTPAIVSPIPRPLPPPPLPPPTHTALFTFNGQFSTVTTTSDITNSHYEPTVLQHISAVRTELERVSCLRLRPQNPKEPLVTFSHGLAVRFVCVHSIPLGMFVPLDGPTTGGGQELRDWVGAIKKDIKGELDVITVVDDSHCLPIPGQMTVVRFMMGVVDVV